MVVRALQLGLMERGVFEEDGSISDGMCLGLIPAYEVLLGRRLIIHGWGTLFCGVPNKVKSKSRSDFGGLVAVGCLVALGGCLGLESFWTYGLLLWQLRSLLLYYC